MAQRREPGERVRQIHHPGPLSGRTVDGDGVVRCAVQNRLDQPGQR
jgi:hypothetical protein